MSRRSKAALVGFVVAAAFLSASAVASADSNFLYYDFTCPKLHMERHKETLTIAVTQGNKVDTVEYSCDLRSCFSLQRPGENEGGGLRVRHIYFPEGKTEFIYSTAVWFGDEKVPRVADNRVIPLTMCGSE